MLGDVNAVKVKLINSRVEGIVYSANQELILNNSRISKLVMKKAQNQFLSTADIHDILHLHKVPADIGQLVEYALLDKMEIVKTQNQYIVKIGEAEFIVKENRQGKSDSIMTGRLNVKNMTVTGSLFLGRRTVIDEWNDFDFKNIDCSPNISFEGDIKIEDKNGQKYQLGILNDFQKVKQAYNLINKIKNDNKKQDELPQVVMICGGHVDEIIFEVGSGIVLCEGGGCVGKIINGHISVAFAEENLQVDEAEKKAEEIEVKKILEEAPEEFSSPITFEVMSDPYKTPLGHYFDKQDLIDLIFYSKNPQEGKFVCPLTRNVYTLNECVRANDLRERINEWLKTHQPI